MNLLQLEAVRKTYGVVEALDGVSLAVSAGSRTAVVGPSGSGKTTLLRIIAGYDRPDSGRVLLGGECLADATHFKPPHLRNIGVVAQDGALFPHLSIGENIGFGIPRDDSDRAGRIRNLMQMVGLDDSMLIRRPDQLSGGQQQRVALARALARKPRLMLLDEPFSALDTGLRASTRKAVSDLLEAEGVTTILVTHDQAEALSFADQVAIMQGGQILQAGAPRDLYARPLTPMIAEFLGDAIVLQADRRNGWAQCELGRVAIDDACVSGYGPILLRPEQISLTEGSGATNADVVGIDFGGASSLVTLRLHAAADGNRDLTVRRAGLENFQIGGTVGITVNGTAHAFRCDGTKT